MPTTVLGKRARTALDITDTPTTKRRTPFVISSDNDENHNPFVTRGVPPTPKTPRTPSTPKAAPLSIYNLARNAFRHNNGKLIAREAEKAELSSFIMERAPVHKSGCLYISGPPGTGKSALVNEVCEELEHSVTLHQTYVNCVSVKNAAGVYAKLLEDFGQSKTLVGRETEALQTLFRKSKTSHLVVLDEIDHLLEVDLELLYQLFQWSLQKSSNLMLVGIANALDFTDRFLPRLKNKGLKPQLLPFMPYSAAQVSDIISTKLKELLPANPSVAPDYTPFIHPTAIMFASKKVAAQTGDLRKAFSICIRAIDLIENETRTKFASAATQITPSPSPSPSKTPLMENINLSSPRKGSPLRNSSLSPMKGNISPKKAAAPQQTVSASNVTIETAPRATIAHMARVTAAAFSNGTTQRLLSLNLQQKAALCSLVHCEQRNRTKTTSVDSYGNPITPSKHANAAPTVRTLFDTYASLCKRDNVLHPLTATEFRDVISGLETLGLVSWAEGRNGSFTPSRTPSRLGTGAGTPSRRGRKAAFGGPTSEEKRVVSSVGVKELRESLKGVGSEILLGLLEDDGF